MKTYLYNPGGNPTLLIENLNNKLSNEIKNKLSKKFLKTKQCEQIAFIEKSEGKYKCQMMGDELCINALRSVGAWVNQKTGLSDFKLSSSGTEQTIQIQVKKMVNIKLPLKFKKTKLTNNLNLIELEGIAHLTLKSQTTKSKKCLLNLLAKKSNELKKYSAIGVMSYMQKHNKLKLSKALVYVKQTNSYIFETACGSGSIAISIAENLNKVEVIQPSKYTYEIKSTKKFIELNGLVEEKKQ